LKFILNKQSVKLCAGSVGLRYCGLLAARVCFRNICENLLPV